jgi:hypothetical protein
VHLQRRRDDGLAEALGRLDGAMGGQDGDALEGTIDFV